MLISLYIITNLNYTDYYARIDENWVIKIADFGLSELMTATKDYYRQSKDVNIKLPVGSRESMSRHFL